MTKWKRVKRTFLAVVVLLGGLEIGLHATVPGYQGFISTAEAVVGRPLTPVSVAGVGRRTARRCAAGVYDC